MNDTFSSTTHTSFFASVKNAIIGTLVGLVMVPSAIGVLAWNEYRTIHRTQGIDEGAAVVQTIKSPSSADPQLTGALVHFVGRAETQERLRDDLFGVEMQAIRLERDVETYQWVENKTTSERAGKKTTTYDYAKQWQEASEPSTQFQHPKGHENVEPHFTELSKIADTVNVGAYRLDGALKNSIDSREKLKWSKDLVDVLPEEIQANSTTKGDYLYWSQTGSPDIAAPVIGDQRISFSVVRPTEVSLVAAVSAKYPNELVPFVTRHGEKLERLFVGNFTAAEVFEKMQGENQKMAWILRGGGLLCSFIGFTMIMGVISAFTERIPLIGSMAGSVVGFVSFLLAIIVTSLTIAIAWIAVRPLVGILLISVAVAISVVVWRSVRKGNEVVAAPIAQ